MQRFLLLILTTAMALPQTTFAQLQSVYVQRMMSLDKNKDGFLAADELPGKLADQLKPNDRDEDGRLSPAELVAMEATARAARDSRPSDSTSTSDTRKGASQRRGGRNSEGTADKRLDPAQILRFALTFDANGDGGLDAEELKKYSIGLAARRSGLRGVQGVNHQPGRTPRSPQPGGKIETPAKAAPTKGLSADGKSDGGFGD